MSLDTTVGSTKSQYVSKWHGSPVLCHAHVSKTGGSSLEIEMMRTNYTVWSKEVCLDELRLVEWCASTRERAVVPLIFLRAPREHVLSQYMECAYSAWAQRQGFPVPRRAFHEPNRTELRDDFAEWLGHFKDDWKTWTGDFGCYCPRNFQTRSLACSTEVEMKHGAESGEERTADAAVAKMQKGVVEKHGVVGITELFQESLCLIHLRMSGALPEKGCGCDANGDAVPAHNVHETKDLPVHSVEWLTSTDVANIDELTRADAQVYVAGLKSLLHDLHRVGKEEGKRLLCPRRVTQLRETLSYVPGADTVIGQYLSVDHGEPSPSQEARAEGGDVPDNGGGGGDAGVSGEDGAEDAHGTADFGQHGAPLKLPVAWVCRHGPRTHTRPDPIFTRPGPVSAQVHVPKTGTSFLNTLGRSVCIPPFPPFDLGQSQHSYWEKIMDGSRCNFTSFQHDGYASPPGHRGFGPFADGQQEQGVTILRQPEQRIISGYHHDYHSYDVDSLGKPSLDTYARAVAGCSVRMLVRGSEPNSTDGGLAACGHSPPPSVEETSRAKDILSQMQFVGLTEKWDLTVCLWHARFGPPSCDPSEFVDTRPGEMAAENTWYGTKPFEQTGFRDEHDGALYKHAENLFWGALHRLNLTRDQCDDWKRSCIAWSSVHGVG